MADAITRHEELLITARDIESVRLLLAERLSEEQIRRVTLFACDNNDTWARDVAPITILSSGEPKDYFHPRHLLDFVSMDGERSLQQRKITESTDRLQGRTIPWNIGNS